MGNGSALEVLRNNVLYKYCLLNMSHMYVHMTASLPKSISANYIHNIKVTKKQEFWQTVKFCEKK